MSGNFLSCSKGVKDPLDVPEVRCEKPRNASAEMGLISPGGENLLDILDSRQVLSAYDGEHRDPLWGLRKSQFPFELLGGHSGFLSRRCRCLRLPGAIVRMPARDKVMRKEADIRKACSDFRDPSANS